MTFTDIMNEEILKTPNNDPYENSVFKTLNKLSSATKGKVGEKIIQKYFSKTKDAQLSPQVDGKTSEYDLLIEGKKVELKSGFVNVSNSIAVNHIRHHYEYDVVWLCFFLPENTVVIRELQKEEVIEVFTTRHSKKTDDDYGKSLIYKSWCNYGKEVFKLEMKEGGLQ